MLSLYEGTLSYVSSYTCRVSIEVDDEDSSDGDGVVFNMVASSLIKSGQVNEKSDLLWLNACCCLFVCLFVCLFMCALIFLCRWLARA